LTDEGERSRSRPPVQAPGNNGWVRFVGYVKRKRYERATKKKSETPTDRAARRTAAATAWMAGFTFVLAATSGLTIWVLKNQLREMHQSGADTHDLAVAAGKQADAAKVQSEQAKAQTDKMAESLTKTDTLIRESKVQATEATIAANAARRAADTAAKQMRDFENAQRADLEVEMAWTRNMPPTVPDSNATQWILSYKITNYGRSVATKIAYDYSNTLRYSCFNPVGSIQIGINPVPLNKIDLVSMHPSLSGEVLDQGRSISGQESIYASNMSTMGRIVIRSRECPLYLVRVVYEDILGEERHAFGCVFFDGMGFEKCRYDTSGAGKREDGSTTRGEQKSNR
jgi:hypothetical protein